MDMVSDLELKELRLDLIDMVSPYGVSGKELFIFDNEVRVIAGMSANRRGKALNELCNKIRAHYKKMRRVK